VLGDDVFFKGLNIYLTKNKFKSAEYTDLRLALEEASGQDLNWFFNEWFLQAGHPRVGVGRNYNAETKTQNLTIDFLPNGDDAVKKYTIPIKVDFYFKDSVHHENIMITQLKNEWNFNFNEQPLLINVDAERSVLWEVEYNKTKEELIYQAKHAPLYADKKEALDKLLDNKELSQEEKNSLIDYCLDNSFYGIKAYAADFMEFMRDKDLEPYFNRLSQLVVTEKKSSLRVSFLRILSVSKTHDVLPVLRACTNDSSYLVMSAALDLLSEKDNATALKICQANEQVENAKVSGTILSIYAKDTLADHSNYFARNISMAKGYDKSIRLRELEYYIHKTSIDNAYQTINAIVKVKPKIMLDYTGDFFTDLEKYYQSKRTGIENETTRSHDLEMYDKILKLLE
jgi:aminopeptidase N